MAEDDTYRRAQRRRNDRNRTRLNDTLLDGAANHRKQWTGPELEILARRELGAKQAAEMLGRSYHAVKHMRRKLQVDPRKIRLAGTCDPPIA
jgi:hypothetical protein